MFKRLFSIVIIGLLVIGCAKQSQKTITEEPMFSFEKTACMGACPVFTFLLYEDGRATYEGKRNVKYIGSFEKKLSDQQLKSFIELLISSDISQYEDSYRGNATDLPTTKIYYYNNGSPKHITDYYGAPESLKQTEKKLSDLINTIEWQ